MTFEEVRRYDRLAKAGRREARHFAPGDGIILNGARHTVTRGLELPDGRYLLRFVETLKPWIGDPTDHHQLPTIEGSRP